MAKKIHRHFLDFENEVKEVYDQLIQLRLLSQKDPRKSSPETRKKLELKLLEKKIAFTRDLTPWQVVQLSRHPERPYTLRYIEQLTTDFVEMSGDRKQADDKAIVGGFAFFAGQTVMFIGHQKGFDTHSRQYRNFGMPNPPGYRKALRLMKLAEKFNKPIITLIDTPGAHPGIESQTLGGGEAIARNIYEMVRLEVPVICAIIGEGGSGGALGIGVGDRVLMLEHTWYSVASPESCSAILWHTWDQKENAAKQLHLTAKDMLGFGLVDEIVGEPDGGAHWDYRQAAVKLKVRLMVHLDELKGMDSKERVRDRIKKFSGMGFWD
ncbi:MAG: acetyl-CoA carboxylase carboxyltransferase subunit alpha [Chitinophagaceae bacterium]